MRQPGATETTMAIKNAPTRQGRESASGLKEATQREERKVESRKGSELKKGAERFEERSRSSDGRGPGTKQDL
jgi:hypothetical protein